MTRPALRPATEADAAAIRVLLEASDLPTGDLTESRVEFVVACADADVIAAGGLERCDASGLLHSVVVSERWRGAGLGGAIVAYLEARARELALGELVLLTQTAVEFFARRGFRVIARSDAPVPVQHSEEFRLLCPQSAVCMMKALGPARAAAG